MGSDVVVMLPGVGTTDCAPELDRTRLDPLVDSSPQARALVLRILQAFETGARDTVLALRLAAHGGDGAELRRLCHRLRGSAATIGLTRVAALCRAIELDAEQGLACSPDACTELELAVTRGLDALRAYADEIG